MEEEPDTAAINTIHDWPLPYDRRISVSRMVLLWNILRTDDDFTVW